MRNEELIVSHMDYARRIASNFQNHQVLHFEASDLESEALFGLVKAGERFDPARNVPFRVFVRVRIAGAIEDFLRYRNQTPFHELLDIHSVPAGLDEVEDHRRLRQTVAGLPERWRRVLVMRFWFGFSHKEVAARMGVGECRVRQIQTQAFQRMREALA
jgi:RNA polymerase sigma factor (sigma-70 family)